MEVLQYEEDGEYERASVHDSEKNRNQGPGLPCPGNDSGSSGGPPFQEPPYSRCLHSPQSFPHCCLQVSFFLCLVF